MSSAPLKPTRRWTREVVIFEIRMLSDRSAKSVQRGFPGLYGAAVRHFGSWKHAVSNAGYDYSSIAKRRIPGYWTRERVISEIQKLEEKHSNSVRLGDASLYSAALRVFGSWESAVKSSGFEYQNIKRGQAKRRFT